MPEVDLRYPIGKVADQPLYSREINDEEAKKAYLLDIQTCPDQLEHAILNLDESQLNTPYREGGWTVKQTVHHVADSHMNAYIRFKLGLTENNPVIKPYEQAEWAKLDDSRIVPINVSLTLLHSLHIRWYELIKNLTKAEWCKTVFHPEQARTITLWELLQIYSWHGRHHTAHITRLRERMGW
jgi:uncharacterized damage-inducible protein DinB